MAGESVVGLAVDEEADGGDLGEGGVEGADDRFDGEGFDLDAGGVIVDEAAAQVDDGQGQPVSEDAVAAWARRCRSVANCARSMPRTGPSSGTRRGSSGASGGARELNEAPRRR